ncbi:MAG: hypothetical protein ABJN26_00070 [Stappiaceae bacterium]
MTEANNAMNAVGKWHVDRRVPLALIATMVIQTGAIVWWAGNINNRVEQLEADAPDSMRIVERVARLETHIETMKEYLRRIDGKLDRVANQKSD